MSVAETDFRPFVKVFDANVALGRRHDRRVTIDTARDTLTEMDRVGVQQALVYSPHAAAFDAHDGNQLLLDMIGSESRLVPQFVCNPSYDDLDSFARWVKDARVRSLRMLPTLHRYPMTDWVVGPWLRWAASEDIPIWMPFEYGVPVRRAQAFVRQFDPDALRDALVAHPAKVVLSEVQYTHANSALKLLESLPNLSIEISRFVGTDGIADLLKTAGPHRVLFGSRFPESSMAAQLYYLHNCGLDERTLAAICWGNLERLLGGS